jgi:hypothetical protein
MALPDGLVPVAVFVLTVGVAVPVTLGSHLFYRAGETGFTAALRAALAEAAGLYLVGVLVVWSIAGGVGLWEIPVTLLVAGALALVVLGVVPLAVGRRLVRRFGAVDGETALRFATYGWPVAMLAVFGVFVAPGGVVRGDLLSLGGERACLAGFCGVSVSLIGAVALEAFVAVFGPGAVGVVLSAREFD